MWKKLWSKFDRYSHQLLKQGELEVPSPLNSILEWLIVGARSGGPRFATPSGKIVTLSVTTLRNRVAPLEQ